MGLKIISPYWHVDELEYMRRIVSLGFKIMICGVAAWGLDESWLGRIIDDEAIDELVGLNEKYYVDIAFEGGEAETLAIDGPIFKKRLKVLKYKKEWHLVMSTAADVEADVVCEKQILIDPRTILMFVGR